MAYTKLETKLNQSLTTNSAGAYALRTIIEGDQTLDSLALGIAGDSLTGDGAHTLTVAGFTTWDMGAVASVGFDGAVEFQTAANTNQLYLATGGQNIMGHNASISVADVESRLQIHGITASTASESIVRYSATQGVGAYLTLGKSASGSVGGITAVANGDLLGAIRWSGVDVTTTGDIKTLGAYITGRVNGTVAADKIPTDIEFHTALGTVANDIDLSAKIQKDAMLDLYGGTITILAGAEDGLKLRTSGNDKYMRFAMPHQVSATQPAVSLFSGVTGGSANILNIGGGEGSLNSATLVRIYAGDNRTTLTGTEVARFEGGAAKTLMMGLGNSSLEAWANTYTALQVAGASSLSGLTTQSATDNLFLTHNGYWDGSNWKYISTNVSNEASQLRQKDGAFDFFVTNTAGAHDANISWTTALTIANDASATFGGAIEINGVATIQGAEGLAGQLYIYADEGDDDADKWLHSALTTGGYTIGTKASGSWLNALTIASDLSATFGGNVIIPGANFRGKVNVADTNYGTSALTDDYIIAFTSLSAARTVTISDEDIASGSITVPRIMIIKDESGSCSGANTITIALESGNIDGAANVVLDTAYSSITLYLNGTNGFIY